MSGNPNLERDIGELSGILKGMGPELERLERRMNAAETKAAASTVEVKHMIKQFVAFRDQTLRAIDSFKQKAADVASAQQGATQALSTAVNDVRTKLETIQTNRSGARSLLWDV